MSVFLCALVLFQASSTQSDWVSGPGMLGPVTAFGSAFYASDSVSYNITGQISPVATSVNYDSWIKHVIEKHNGIRGHGGLYPADLDNDGDLDLAGWMTGCCTLRLYRNDMRGDTANFVKVASYVTPRPSKYPNTGYGFIWAGDVDNDGLADIVVPGESVLVCFKNLGGFQFRCCTLGRIREAEPFCEGVDVDRDGRIDIIEGDSALTVWHNLGNMRFQRDSFGVGVNYKLKTGDLNNDGYPDLLSGGHVHLSNHGVFSMPPTWDGNLTGVDGVWIRDYNNDGRADLLICDQWAATPAIYWYENLDSGRTYRQHTVVRGGHAQSYGDGACAEDMDIDGLADVVGSYSRVGFFRQYKRDSFREVQIDTITDSHWVLARNLDYHPGGYDCDIDILASSNHQFAWWENRMISAFSGNGQLTSSILDAGAPMFWRRLVWDAVRPPSTGLDFYVRTGTSPDELQGRAWQGPIPARTGFELDSADLAAYATPLDRYFQYQVRMTGAALAPVVYSVRVVYDPAQVDVGVRSVLAPSGTVDSGSVVTPQALVHNYGNAATATDIEFRIDDGYANTITRTIGPGADSVFSFAAWTALARGTHAVQCSTKLNDQNNANNKAVDSVVVRVTDVGVVRITAPVGPVDSGAVVAPRAVVHNYGSRTATFPVVFRIDDGYFAQVNLSLAPGADSSVLFANWTALRRGTHAVCCSTKLGDENPANDWARDSVMVGVLDVGVRAILEPTGSVRYGITVSPLVLVRNYSTTRDPVTVTLSFAVSSYIETLTLPDGLPASDTVLQFADWRPDTGHYAGRCSVAMAGDMNPVNDTIGNTFSISVSAPRWVPRTGLLLGARSKRVKDGAALAYNDDPDAGAIYAFKGNNTCEFYRYRVLADAWATRESIPLSNAAGKKKTVRKGASLTQVDGLIYGTKGNNSYDFWRYDPLAQTGSHWSQRINVPQGSKAIREGSGMVDIYVGGLPYVYLLKGSGTYEFYRYSITSNAWETMAPAPAGASRRGFKNGSCIAYDPDSDTVFALKATYNEFFAYSVRSNTWVTKETLPKVSPPRTAKKKVKDGAALAYHGGSVYALKGGNTYEFWKFPIAARHWYTAEDILPGPSLKRVRGGGAMVYAPCKGNLYALKGNNTLEFDMYWLSDSIYCANPQHEGELIAAVFPDLNALSIRPNPAGASALVRYDLPVPGRVSVRLYDVSGALKTTVWNGYQFAGRQMLTIDCRNLAAGIYLVRCETDRSLVTRKLIIDH